MSATYLSAAALQQLEQAQATVDEHLRMTVAGRCRACGEPSPCPALTVANATFARYQRLPRRTPGVTVPDFLKRVA
jgi:hypothetical protein